ncbi:uncharacterized protein B4U80_10916, partial [Leptotrombidium deliense]
MGTLPTKHKIVIDESVVPSIMPVRRVPHAIRQKFKNELDAMETAGIIEKVVEPTKWVNSFTAVRKPNKLRICLDPSRLNKAIISPKYPIPTFESVLTKVKDAKYFTVLDLKKGFLQLELDEASTWLCVFNTPFGRYKFNRLPFGISSAPEAFQQTMEEVFGDIEGIFIYIDDIFIPAE